MAGTAQGDRAARDTSGGPSESRPGRWDRPIRRKAIRGAVVRGGVVLGQETKRMTPRDGRRLARRACP